MAEDLTEGWTGPLDFILLIDGVAANLTGATVELVLYDSLGTLVTTSGDVTVVTAATGHVRYTPDSTDLSSSLSPYKAKFKVTLSGEVTFFPKGAADVWTVYR